MVRREKMEQTLKHRVKIRREAVGTYLINKAYSKCRHIREEIKYFKRS